MENNLPEKKKIGRPKGSSLDKTQKLKAKNKEVFLKALEETGSILKKACEIAGFNRGTFNVYYNEDIEFRMRVDDIREGAIDNVESQLMNQINSGSTIATLFFLKCKGKNRGWIDKSEVTVDVNEKITITYVLPEVQQNIQLIDNQNVIEIEDNGSLNSD